MKDMITFENWPYELLRKVKEDKHYWQRKERLLILKAEYYGRGKTDDQKARSIGMTRTQYYHLKKKHGLMEDGNGNLREPREKEEEWWGDEEYWHDN